MSKSPLSQPEVKYPIDSNDLLGFLSENSFVNTEITISVIIKKGEKEITIPLNNKLTKEQVITILDSANLSLEDFEKKLSFIQMLDSSVKTHYLK